MEQKDIEAAHTALIGFTKRAEKATEAILVATFVDSAPLFSLRSTENNQVIYGRRGTGKTHALKYLAEHIQSVDGAIPVYVDLRTIGSNGSIYGDGSVSLVERASTLLADVLGGLLNEFYAIALDVIATHPNPNEVTKRLDRLQEAISTVRISGEVEQETSEAHKSKHDNNDKASLSLSNLVSASFEYSASKSEETFGERKLTRSGTEIIHLSFGSISAAIANVVSIFRGRRVWFLIDEWSEIPIELQPYLADLIRRAPSAERHDHKDCSYRASHKFLYLEGSRRIYRVRAWLRCVC